MIGFEPLVLLRGNIEGMANHGCWELVWLIEAHEILVALVQYVLSSNA